MRTAVRTLATTCASVAALLLAATPASAGAGNGTTTYSGKYSNSFTGWTESASLTGLTSHAESATDRGTLSTSVSVVENTATGTARSTATVHHVVRLQPNPHGYRITATFTGVAAQGSTYATLRAIVSPQCQLGNACPAAEERVTTPGVDQTLTYTLPPVTTVSTLSIDPGLKSQVTAGGAAQRSEARGTVSRITLTPLTQPAAVG